MLHGWNLPHCRSGVLLFTAVLCLGCDTSQKRALKELNLDGVEPSGRSLVRAALLRNSARASLLLEAGVCTEQRDPLGQTPLAIAVNNRDLPTTLILLNAHANVNATSTSQACILGFALQQADAILTEILLESGASTDGLMPDGEKILPWAIRQGRFDLVKMMMQSGSDPHLKDRNGNPLLHVAIESGRRDLMEALIQLGADPGGTNAAGETTIHLALRQGWTDVIPKLAAAGADPNAFDLGGLTLLDRAVADGNSDRVALLLKIGADPNHCQNPGSDMSPLEKVFDSPDPTLFQVFLNHGAKPPRGDWSPWLWRTLQRRDLEKARLLLAHGTRTTTPGPAGLNLLESAVLAGQFNFVKLLMDYDCAAGRAVDFACERGDHEMLGLLLACGVPLDRFTRIPSRDTLLAAALRKRHDRLAECLVRYGVDTRLSLSEGQSAFHLAVATGCQRTVKQLLAMGAAANAPFVLPVSPVFLEQVRPGVMRWLLKTDRNVTPLMVAADAGNISVARHLLESGARTEVWTRFSELWPMDLASRRNDVQMMRLFLGQDPYREERRIEVRLSEQRARLMDACGKEIFTTRISTGRAGFTTPTGEYAITNKHRDWTSTLYHASMPYFLRLSCGAFGLHQGYVPDYPASHGCIRVPEGKAAKLFAMTQTGDRVTILP